ENKNSPLQRKTPGMLKRAIVETREFPQAWLCYLAVSSDIFASYPDRSPTGGFQLLRPLSFCCANSKLGSDDIGPKGGLFIGTGLGGPHSRRTIVAHQLSVVLA